MSLGGANDRDSGRGKKIVLNFDEMLDELNKRYPNDALRIDELKSDKEKTEYVAKLKLIREIKVMTGRM